MQGMQCGNAQFKPAQSIIFLLSYATKLLTLCSPVIFSDRQLQNFQNFVSLRSIDTA